MKKTLFTAIFLSISILGIYGQVETRFFPNRDALQQNRLLKEHRRVAKIKAMPPLDIQKIASARQQERDDNVPFRFGEGFDTRITLADGEWTDTENGRLWTMAIESKGAYSINFVFNDFYLPEGAELYISNEEGDMLYGPVTSKANTENGHFLTDLIKGDKVSIYLFEPSNKRNESQLTIKRVVHAYENMFSDMAYGQVGSSGSCNNNVACFPAWSKESDAVALVLLSNGTEWCSGSLLMTANQSFRPYFLSAFHCIDTDIPKGSLSSSEISNAENWMFKFQYKMSSCSGGYATSGVTYNRATFRAAWNNTDFALMELRNSPAGDPRFSWLGWDRSGNTPTSGTGIHHPSGDVMKISFDNQQLQTSSWGGNNNHWLLSFDNGVVEHGSSGSPLFNQNKRVVGQLHGNQNYNSARPYCEQFRAEYGQFHRSWTGGGTNSTRLSNWLDPNGSGVMTTNTSKYPTLIGPMTICNQPNYTYTIKNLPQGATVQWSSSNNSMTLQSGQGTATALFRQTGFTNAEIRAAVRFNGATIANLAQAITICQPFLSGPSAICNQATYTVENLPPGLQVQWQVHPGLHVYGQTNNSISVSKQSLTSPIEKGWVKATIVGTNITFRNDDILVWKSGTTQTNDLLVGQLDAFGGQVEAVYPIQELGRNFQWSASNNWQAMIQGYHFTDFSGTPQSGASSVYITVRFDDPCGSETIIYKEFELPSTYGFSLSPNPVTDVTTLQWKLSGEAISMNSNSQVTQPVVWNRSPYEIQLWSGMTMLRSFRTDEPTFQIPMAGLPAGLYFVRVVKDGQTYTQKLIKK